MSHRCANVSPCNRPTCHICNVDVPQHAAQHFADVEQKRHERQVQWAQNNLDFHTEELIRLHAELGRLRHRRNQLLLQQDQQCKRRELMIEQRRTQEQRDADWELVGLRDDLWELRFPLRSTLDAIEWNERQLVDARERLDELVAR